MNLLPMADSDNSSTGKVNHKNFKLGKVLQRALALCAYACKEAHTILHSVTSSAQRISRACQPCPRFKPGQNRSGGWPGDVTPWRDPRGSRALGAGHWFCQGVLGVGCWSALPSAPANPGFLRKFCHFVTTWAILSVLWAAPRGSANQHSQAINNQMVLPGTKNCYQSTPELGNRGCFSGPGFVDLFCRLWGTAPGCQPH